MMRVLVVLLMAAAVALLVSPAVFADPVLVDVVVKPSAMNGWVLPTPYPDPLAGEPYSVNGARAWLRDPAPPKGGIGTGAFYCHAGFGGSYAGSVPGSAWIGTEQFAGVRLDKITKLSYSTWQDCSAAWLQGALTGPRQPFHIQMVINRNDGSGLQSTLMFRPFDDLSGTGGGVNAYPTDARYRAWNEFSTTEGKWIEFMDGAFPAAPAEIGYFVGQWADMITRYPDATIAASPGVDCVWPSFATPTGCGFNLVMGGQANQTGIPTLDVNKKWKNWWREGWNSRAFVDGLIVGIVDENQVDTWTTFDFEADSPNPPVQINCGATLDQVIRGLYYTPSPTYPVTDQPQKPRSGDETFPYVVCGRVIAATTDGFIVNDGTKHVEVRGPGASLAGIGEFWRAKGVLDCDYTVIPCGAYKMILFSDAYSICRLD